MEDFAKELPEPVKFYTDYHRDVPRSRDRRGLRRHAQPVARADRAGGGRNGKHVLVTKPLADSDEAARELVEAAEAAGVVNMMSLSTRFSDEVRYLGKLAQAGRVGRPLLRAGAQHPPQRHP